MQTELIRQVFHAQAEACNRLGAPFTAEVVETLGNILDDQTEAGRQTLAWGNTAGVHGDAVPLRLAGALHYLARTGRGGVLEDHYKRAPNGPGPGLGAAIAETVTREDAVLTDWLQRAPQTNEVGRSAVLYAGLMFLAEKTGLPMTLAEVGASAGLNLIPDHYGYRFGSLQAGRAESPVQIRPDWHGPPPPDVGVRILSRSGADLAPIDVRDAEAVERMLAYIWPDQPERLNRATAAIALAREAGVAVDTADAADFVERAIPREPTPGCVRVLQHSIAYQYFPERVKARIRDHMKAAAASAHRDAPVAWLMFEQEPDEPPLLTLTLWPDGTRFRLAEAHPHGRSVHWDPRALGS